MKLILYLLAAVIAAQCALQAQSNIKPGESYAWAGNIGWTELIPNRPTPLDGVQVGGTCLSGYAWSDSTGWITLGTGLLKTNFTFPPLSSNVDLAGLILSTGNLSPVFDPAVTTYTSDAAYGTSSVVIIPTQAHAGASIKVNGQTVVSGTASEMVPLTGSSTPLSIEVTAQDGLTTKTYHVSVNILNANQISLASSFFTVFSTPAATTVDVVINRANSLTGTVSCELSATDGSAISPGDYAAQNATTVTFADGVMQQRH